jgi:hypothetical protein
VRVEQPVVAGGGRGVQVGRGLPLPAEPAQPSRGEQPAADGGGSAFSTWSGLWRTADGGVASARGAARGDRLRRRSEVAQRPVEVALGGRAAAGRGGVQGRHSQHVKIGSEGGLCVRPCSTSWRSPAPSAPPARATARDPWFLMLEDPDHQDQDQDERRPRPTVVFGSAESA